jgi:hypothetical protein
MLLSRSLLVALGALAGCGSQRTGGAPHSDDGAADGASELADAAVPATDTNADADIATSFTCPQARALEDAPDDDAGHQVRVLYVLPSDGADDLMDVDGRICRSLLAASAWLVAQADGARLRLDTRAGVLDIGFARLGKTDAEMRGAGGATVDDGHAYLRDRIERELARAVPLHPRKIYAVYYGGTSPFSCGGGAWPPGLRGQVAALYLGGEPPGASPCRSNPVGASPTRPGYVEYSLIHEIMHTLGVVAEGAPNHHAAGHVFDGSGPPARAARDLMYAARSSADPGWATGDADGLALDLGRDDYYGHGRPDLVDLARSAFLTPLPADARLPPGW